MSARKKTSTQGNMDRVTLMSDYGELPGYNVDDYADRLTVARRKFDRLCRFSLDEHETSFENFELFRQVGGIVAKILRGAKPSEFPIQRPVYLSFLINMQTARLLQLTIPPSLSALADEVIE